MITMDHTLTQASQLLQIEDDHVAHNYHPLDVVVQADPARCSPTADGEQYLDFLAAYSASELRAPSPERLSQPPRSSSSDSR